MNIDAHKQFVLLKSFFYERNLFFYKNFFFGSRKTFFLISKNLTASAFLLPRQILQIGDMPQQKPRQISNVEVSIQLVVLDQQAFKYCILDKDLMEFLLSVFLKTVIDAFLKFGYSVFCSIQMHSQEKMFKSISTTLVLLEYYLQFQFDKHVHSAQAPPPTPRPPSELGGSWNSFHFSHFQI